MSERSMCSTQCNGLSLAIAALMPFSPMGHALAGHRFANEERRDHGQSEQTIEPLGRYLFDAEFWYQCFQNWRSRFLAIPSLILPCIRMRDIGE